jgi:ElaB/YqjD/DUF883 family membrane-anchored ribosome-binding protein
MSQSHELAPAAEAAASVSEGRAGSEASDAMRRDIVTTRAAIDEKLDALQDKARSVRTKAQQAFDPRHQIHAHPWAAMGVAVAAGFLAGRAGSSPPQAPEAATMKGPDGATGQQPRQAPIRRRRELLETLKLAMGAALLELARQAVHSKLPALGVQLDKVWEGRGMTSISAASALIGTDVTGAPD